MIELCRAIRTLVTIISALAPSNEVLFASRNLTGFDSGGRSHKPTSRVDLSTTWNALPTMSACWGIASKPPLRNLRPILAH